MFTVTKYPQGFFSWADHNSTDPAAAKRFYTELLGWTVEDRPITGTDMTYTMYFKDGHAVAGGGQAMPGTPSAWVNYIAVDDLDEVAGRVEALGGTLVMPPMDVMGEGRMAMIQDPSGAHVGLWQAGAHIGAGLVNTVGAMSWNELNTHNVEAAKAFFAALLGWTYEVMPVDYTVIQNKGRANGGMLAIDPSWGQMPSHWVAYFTVANIDESVAKAESLGGKMIMRSESGGGAMKFAVISDPTGATFTLIQTERLDPWVE